MYSKASKLIEEFKKEYEQIPIEMLRKAIQIQIGYDEKRVVIPYLKMMSDLGLIKINGQIVELK